MIDSNEINATIQSAVAAAVKEEVQNLFKTDEQLLATIRSQAVSLLVRNFNLDALVKQNMAADVAEHVAGKLLTEQDSPLDTDLINTTVADNIADATSGQVGDLINNDAALLGNLKRQAITELVRIAGANVDFEAMITSKISTQFAEQFNSTGVYSEAKKRELTVMDDAVVVEGTLTSKNVNVVEGFTTKDATVGNLKVTGNIDLTTSAWSPLTKRIKADVIDAVQTGTVKGELVNAVIAKADTINFKEIRLGDKPVLSGNALGNQITDSSLTSVGELTALKVTGKTDLGALHVVGNRVGINTESPNSALAVWDDEVEIIAGKFKAQSAFIGTNRSQELVLGVNRGEHIKIDNDGLVTIQKLKLGLRTIAHGKSVPGYSGTPGDLVLNTALTVDNPVFAWFCLHDYSWVPLKATI